MKIAVMSDSHDNIWKLRKALGIIKLKNCEKIIHKIARVGPRQLIDIL